MSAIATLVYGILVPNESPLHARIASSTEDNSDDDGEPFPGSLLELFNTDRADSGIAIVPTGNDCSDDNLRLILGVVASRLRVWPYEPSEVVSLTVDAAWVAALRNFCEKHSIDWIEPKWWLGCWDN